MVSAFLGLSVFLLNAQDVSASLELSFCSRRYGIGLPSENSLWYLAWRGYGLPYRTGGLEISSLLSTLPDCRSVLCLIVHHESARMAQHPLVQCHMSKFRQSALLWLPAKTGKINRRMILVVVCAY